MSYSSVLHVNDKAGLFGGTEEYINSISSVMTGKEIESYLVYGERHSHGAHDLAGTVQVPGLASRTRPNAVPDTVRQIADELRPDVVMLHNVFDARVVTALAAFPRTWALLWYVHDHYPTCLTELRATTEGFPTVCNRSLEAACLARVNAGLCRRRYASFEHTLADLHARLELLEAGRSVDAVLVISQYMKNTLTRCSAAYGALTHLLPRQIRGTERRCPLTAHRTPHLGFVGRIAPEKGLHFLLYALAGMNSMKATLSIAGPVEDDAYWQFCLDLIAELATQHPLLSVKYRGLLSYEKTDELYEDLDVLVVPSLWGEPAGAVAAEGLAHGTCVVATDVGGIGTWIQNGVTGILVDPDDPACLARELRKVIGDRGLRVSLATEGRRRVVGEFNAETHVAHLDRIISLARSENAAWEEFVSRESAAGFAGELDYEEESDLAW